MFKHVENYIFIISLWLLLHIECCFIINVAINYHFTNL